MGVDHERRTHAGLLVRDATVMLLRRVRGLDRSRARQRRLPCSGHELTEGADRRRLVPAGESVVLGHGSAEVGSKGYGAFGDPQAIHLLVRDVSLMRTRRARGLDHS